MVLLVVAGLALLGGSIAGARRPVIPALEQRVFRAVNGWPDWLYPVLWLPMQLGNLVVGTIVGIVAVAALADWWAIIWVLVAMLLKLVTERVIRHQLADILAVRRRPGTSIPGAILRGDVPADGPSFPSGHVLLVTAIAGTVAGVGPGWVDVIAFVLAVTVAVGRVYVGAHNPLDVTAGFGAGLVIGAVLGALRPPADPTRPARPLRVLGEGTGATSSCSLTQKPRSPAVTPSCLARGMTTNLRRIVAVATGQLGSFSRAQAHEHGMTDGQLRRRVQSGFLHQIGPHAFRLAGPSTGPLGEVRALLLDVGTPCWASGPTAAAIHGLDGFRLRPPFHLTLPQERNVRRLNVIVHRSGELPPLDQETVEDIVITSPTRTLIDLARGATAEELTAALDGALRDGLTSEELLHRRIAALRTKGRYGVPLLLDVLDGREVTRGGHSWLEREFLRLVAEAGLPRPECQAVLTRANDHLVRVDCRFVGTPIVVELLGHRFHRTKQRMSRDAERLNALVLDGFTPFQFTYDQVVTQPARVLATVDLARRRESA